MSFIIAQLIIICLACLLTVAASFVLVAPKKFSKQRKMKNTAEDTLTCYVGTSMVIVLSGLLYFLFTDQIIGLVLSTWGPFVNGIFKSLHAYTKRNIPREEIITPWVTFGVMFTLLLLASGVVSF